MPTIIPITDIWAAETETQKVKLNPGVSEFSANITSVILYPFLFTMKKTDGIWNETFLNLTKYWGEKEAKHMYH